MYYYLILALQVYCAYHAYTNRNHFYWYFAIFFVPVIGCLIYLFINVIRKSDVEKVQDNLVSVINPTKKITDLEKKFKFAATFENQVALADAYLEVEDYDRAIENYKASLKDVFKEDFYVLSKLQEAYYFSSQFDLSLEYAKRLKSNSKFKKSRASFLYALALEKGGNSDEAETILKTFDAPYARYHERLELAKFYQRNGKTAAAQELLKEIVAESENMSKSSYRQNRMLIKKAKELVSNEP